MTAALLLCVLTAADDSMAVLPLQARRVESEIVTILDDLLTTELALRHPSTVISARDIDAMLDVEQMKDALGCDDVSCAAEIGGALGTRTLVSGSASRLGTKLIVQLALIDTQNVKVMGRSKASVPDEERYYENAVREAVRQLLEGDSLAPIENSGSKIVFHTTDEELEFTASVVSAEGRQFGCEEQIRMGAHCTVTELPAGEAQVLVSALDHNPASETAKLRSVDGTVSYRVDTSLSTWSWVSYLGGGAFAFTGAAALSLSQLGEESDGFFTGIGITYLVLGAGFLGLGYWLDRDLSLERLEMSEAPETLTVSPIVTPDGAGLGALYRW